MHRALASGAIMKAVVACLLGAVMATSGADLPDGKPTILRALGPVRPGETVLLGGD